VCGVVAWVVNIPSIGWLPQLCVGGASWPCAAIIDLLMPNLWENALISGVWMSSFASSPIMIRFPCVAHPCNIGHKSVQNALQGCSVLLGVDSSWCCQCCYNTDICLFSDLHSRYPTSIRMVRSCFPW